MRLEEILPNKLIDFTDEEFGSTLYVLNSYLINPESKGFKYFAMNIGHKMIISPYALTYAKGSIVRLN